VNLRLSGHPTARISNFFLCNKEEKIKGIRICVCKEKGGGGGGGSTPAPLFSPPSLFLLISTSNEFHPSPPIEKKKIIPDRKYFKS
jgi:hypothetical protein